MGSVTAELLVSDQPFSFWGGYDYLTGEIIDRRHALSGQIAAGKVLAIPYTIGSSTTAQVLLEAIRAGTAPAAIVTRRLDTYLVLAALVAQELYGRTIPVVTVSESEFAELRTGSEFTASTGGSPAHP
jgi:predicted aconitase with swiveling domain